MRPVAALLYGVTRRALGKHGFSSGALIAEWESVVGSELAAMCQPEKLTFPHGKRSAGTLHIRTSGGYALELQHLEPQLVERINVFVGYTAVSRLKLIQARVHRTSQDVMTEARETTPPSDYMPDSEQSLPGLDDTKLRASLERLGAAVRKNESNRKK